MSKNAGGPAFPSAASFDWVKQEHIPADQGMTLRDYFAAKALAGMLADPGVNAGPESVAKVAYSYADAMLAERAK